MNKLLEEKINELKDSMTDYAVDFATNYKNSSQYLCDAIQEFADSNTSIYYSAIMNYIRDNPDAVNDAINEFGWDGCGKDIYTAGQMAEYMEIEHELYGDESNIVKLIAFYNLSEYDNVTDEMVELVDDIDCENIDNGSRISDIDDYIKSLFEGEEDDE